MAVYTEVTDEALGAFLARYDLGRVTSFKGIAEGVENSNFLLRTEAGQFILTLYEKRVHEEDLPFFIGLMEHLAARGVTCPQPVRARRRPGARPPRRARRRDRHLSRRPVDSPPASPSLRPGRRGARAHARGGRRLRAQPRQRAVDRRLAGAVRDRRGARRRSLARPRRARSRPSFARCRRSGRRGLPSGVIHADLFPDNVFFLGDKLSGLIDFYFACNDAFAYDLGDLPQRLVLRARRRVQRLQGHGDDRRLRARCARSTPKRSRRCRSSRAARRCASC